MKCLVALLRSTTTEGETDTARLGLFAKELGEVAKRFGYGLALRDGTVIVKRNSREVKTDPAFSVYETELICSPGIWRETFGSPEHVRYYFRGVEAVASSVGLDVKWPLGLEP